MEEIMKKKVPIETFEQAQDNPDPGYARIVLPEKGEALEEALEVITTDRRCGKCVHFDYELGQKAFEGPNNVYQQLIKERDLASLADAIDPRTIGACRHWSQGEDRLCLVHAMSPAKVAKHYVGEHTSRQDRNKSTRCPDYREVQGKVLRFYKRN